jgi:anti-sigma factor RsiW
MNPDPDRDSAPAPDWQLERYLLGELSAEETEEVRAALDREPALRGRLAALERSNAEILERHPPERIVPAVRSALRTAAPNARRLGAFGPRPLLATACGATAVVGAAILLSARPTPSEPPDVTRVKGLVPQLVLFRRAPSGVERLAPGSVARDHDLVQLAYQAAGRHHGVIVSVDGRGTVTRHLPATGPLAAPLKAGAPVPLPEAYELDDAPGFERFYLVTADEPFAVEDVVAAVRRGRPGSRLDLPASLEQHSVVLQKEPAQ